MSCLILVTSHGLQPEQCSIFLNSLAATGYKGDVGLISNDLVIQDAPYNIIQHEWYENEYFRSSRRLFQYREFLSKHESDWDTVILTGIRDVYFQKDPSTIPHGPLDLYAECAEQKIGVCPYNSMWILNTYGPEEWRPLQHKQVICAEIVVGTKNGMIDFLDRMIEHAKLHQRKHDLEDQAMLNWLYHHNQFPEWVHLVENEGSPVYTVGAMKGITVDKHRIINRNKEIPWIVHQYDRHIRSV